jgi:hypothetical protein
MAGRRLPPGWDEAISRVVEFHRQRGGVRWSELEPLMPAGGMTSRELEDFVQLLAEQGVHPVE